MKQHLYHLSLIIFLLFLCTPFLFGQQKPCNNYACVIDKVERLMKQTQKDYKAILDNLDSAEGYPDSKAEEIRGLRRRVFVLIENEKNEAKRARDEAKKQTEISQKALAQVEIEKQTAVAEKTKAQAAEAKAKSVLDKIYFYDGKFGLAYLGGGFGRYGFIDKNLNVKIDFKYEEALPFDNKGFAKVKFGSADFLIDTNGHEYKLQYDINQLDSSITALDLRNKNLTNIPSVVFDQAQLKVLLLDKNQITNLPIEIKMLTNLQFLSLTHNHISILPFEIEKLTNLLLLDFSFNRLTQIPIGLSNLSNLLSLSLMGNQLENFPNEFCNLTKLKSLTLRGNKLLQIPVEIKNLRNLEYLDLIKNRLTNIPDEVRNLKKLNYFLLIGNKFTKEELEKIKKLLPNCEIIF